MMLDKVCQTRFHHQVAPLTGKLFQTGEKLPLDFRQKRFEREFML